jgi:hypothetical protein
VDIKSDFVLLTFTGTKIKIYKIMDHKIKVCVKTRNATAPGYKSENF